MLGAWPRLSTLNPVWFTVALAAELASFTCNFALQRLALRTQGWFAVVAAGLTGNAITDSLPGGDAAGAAVQFRMLTTAGFDTDTAVGGLTTFSLLGVGGLLALPLFALPTILAARAGQSRAGPYRSARYRRVRPVRDLRRDRLAHGAAAGRTRARGAARVEQAHPRPPAASDRPGHAVAGRTRHDQDGAGQELVAGGPADRRPPRLGLRLPAGRATRHREPARGPPWYCWPTPLPASSRCSRSLRADWASWRPALAAC